MAASITTPSENTSGSTTRRKSLAAAVGAALQEAGFHSAEKAAVGTLTEILQSVISEIGRSSKAFCELAYRAEPVIGDILLALVEMGISVESIPNYGKRPNRVTVSAPAAQVENKQHNVLQVGDKKSHPGHIPEHFPAFPDTHTYCFSHTYKQPVTEYEAIRERAASQKKDIERALTKFKAKTSDTQSLFYTEDKEFMLVAINTNPRPYIDALMPRDQVFEEEDYSNTKIRKKKREPIDDGEEKEKLNESQEESSEHPYLRPVKMPRKVKIKKNR